jgi:hypothetical protein
MVLRKRIKRIRAGMKKYNTQLDEVKRSVPGCCGSGMFIPDPKTARKERGEKILWSYLFM